MDEVDGVQLLGLLLRLLLPNEVLPHVVVVLAEELDELEGSTEGGDAGVLVLLLLGIVWLVHVLANYAFLVDVVVVVVVASVGLEGSVAVLGDHSLLLVVLVNQVAQFFDESLDVLEDLVVLVFGQHLKNTDL